ncbi:cytochrome P450 [Streptomyces zingiberis]|uniref:cytochrome P450 n=1 Tax=Streptomyces zingiberis TaxID=2053010 RepID=UPI001F0EF445|nr:cytochrome P450 [Streptomyces zingiberis]
MTTETPPGCPAHPAVAAHAAPRTGPHTGGAAAPPVPLRSLTGAGAPAAYERLRAAWGPVAPVELAAGLPGWLVLGYREVLAVTRQEQTFSRDARHWRDLAGGAVPPDSPLLPMMAHRDTVAGRDGVEHQRLRRPLVDAMAAADQRRMRRSVEAVCAGLLAAFTGRGTADLVAEYARTVPLLALGGLFGLDRSEARELLRARSALLSGDRSAPAARRFEEILTVLVRDRRAAPRPDLTSAFLAHPDLRDDAEVLRSMVVMISAGNETTTAWIANTLRLMLTDRRLRGRLHGGRLGVDEALDEVLWQDPPLAVLPARFALHDTELGGRPIRRGDALVLGLAAAGADPSVRPADPDGLLGNRAHLAFSAGAHACPAQVTARLIARTAVETALRALPGVTLAAPAEEPAWRPSPWTRCPAALPVRFAPGGGRPAPDGAPPVPAPAAGGPEPPPTAPGEPPAAARIPHPAPPRPHHRSGSGGFPS